MLRRLRDWLCDLRHHATSMHPRVRIIGVIDFYHPTLDTEVGEEAGCWRLPGERDDDYAFRLSVHLSHQANRTDELLKKVLNFKRSTPCGF
jgi:hypothetical protein